MESHIRKFCCYLVLGHLVLSACAPALDVPPLDVPPLDVPPQAPSGQETSPPTVESNPKSPAPINTQPTQTESTSGNPTTPLLSASINEVYYDDPVSDTDGTAFVEIKGEPSSNLSGCVLRFVNGADGKKTAEIIFSAGSFIPSNGLFVVADTRTGSKDRTQVIHYDYLANFDPQDGPDGVQLFSSDGRLLDVVGYGTELKGTDSEGHPLFEKSPAPDAPTGKSIARHNGADTDSNAQDFIINQTPSPKDLSVTVLPEEKVLPSSDPVVQSDSIAQSDSVESSPELVAVKKVSIGEVVTDPQQDWNDSSGGNKVAFDQVVGSGSIGPTDEWIEVVNQTDASVDLTGWRLEMVDGSDATDQFAESSALFLFTSGGSLADFRSQEYLIIGNPEGDMKNQVTLKLFNDLSEIVDEVSIEDGNAASIDDESVFLGMDGISRGKATPGF